VEERLLMMDVPVDVEETGKEVAVASVLVEEMAPLVEETTGKEMVLGTSIWLLEEVFVSGELEVAEGVGTVSVTPGVDEESVVDALLVAECVEDDSLSVGEGDVV
jgi:hypothetical protein